MHNIKYLVIAAAIAATAGCATQEVIAPGPSAETIILTKIAAQAKLATDAQIRLAAMREPNRSKMVGDADAFTGLDTPLTLNWSGEVDKLAQKVADLSDLTYLPPIGTKSATTVNVVISASNVKARYILDDANAQMGNSGRINISEEAKTITVQYPPTMRSGGFPVLK
jgi:hypothetical protein